MAKRCVYMYGGPRDGQDYKVDVGAVFLTEDGYVIPIEQYGADRWRANWTKRRKQ